MNGLKRWLGWSPLRFDWVNISAIAALVVSAAVYWGSPALGAAPSERLFYVAFIHVVCAFWYLVPCLVIRAFLWGSDDCRRLFPFLWMLFEAFFGCAIMFGLVYAIQILFF